MRRDVSGCRPWPGPEWDAFTVAIVGKARRGRYGLADGEAGITREGLRDVFLFGYRARVTPKGRRWRLEPRELVIGRVEVGHPSTSARLVWSATDAVALEFRAERRKHGPATLLDALPLVMERPRLGRPVGSVSDEDGPALQAIIDEVAAGMHRDGDRMTWTALATRIGMDPSTMARKVKRYGLTKPPI